MKVLLLVWDNPYATYGGIQAQVRQLSRLLETNVVVRVLPACHPYLLRGGLSNSYLPLHSIEKALENCLVQEDIDVVHSHNLHRQNGPGVAEKIISTLVRLGIPHLQTVHDFDSEVRRDELDRQASILRTSRCIATSAFIQSKLLEAFSIHAEIIHPCGSCDCLKQEDLTSQTVDKYIIVSPGRLTWQKGHLAATVISGYLSRELGPIQLRFSSAQEAHNGGEQGFINEIVRTAASFPDLEVSFFEGRQVIPDLFANARLTLCLPEALEGFGLGPLESLYSKVPVVARITGGMTWMQQFGAISTVMSGDFPEIAGLAYDVLTQPVKWRRRIQDEYDAIRNLCEPERMVSLYRDIYSTMMTRKV